MRSGELAERAGVTTKMGALLRAKAPLTTMTTTEPGFGDRMVIDDLAALVSSVIASSEAVGS